MEAPQPQIHGVIEAEHVEIGRGVVVEPGAFIGGRGAKAARVVLGDFAYVGRETRVLAPEFWLGDYSKLHAFGFAHGALPLRIGRNCWFGGNVVLDSLGGLDIDDNVGLGAQSQIWTHIQFGDLVQGCRFHSRRHVFIPKDVWFVGHCIVSPVTIGERSMALVGSVITKDMQADRVYAGVPAVDVTDKTGPQFEDIPSERKLAILTDLIETFERECPEHKGRLRACESLPELTRDFTFFDVNTRTYNKRLAPAEVAFLRRNVPLVKFTPAGEGGFWG